MAEQQTAKEPEARKEPRPLTVAVTGPTGDIGIAALHALDASPEAGRVVGMARRPFDPAAQGLSDKVVYQRGDVLNRSSVDALVVGADVVMHLAFILIGDPEDAQVINVEGSRNLFEATVAAGAKRLVYTSSVAAYGFHADNPRRCPRTCHPRHRQLTILGAQSRARGHPRSGSGGHRRRPYVFRPASSPARER